MVTSVLYRVCIGQPMNLIGLTEFCNRCIRQTVSWIEPIPMACRRYCPELYIILGIFQARLGIRDQIFVSEVYQLF